MIALGSLGDLPSVHRAPSGASAVLLRAPGALRRERPDVWASLAQRALHSEFLIPKWLCETAYPLVCELSAGTDCRFERVCFGHLPCAASRLAASGVARSAVFSWA